MMRPETFPHIPSPQTLETSMRITTRTTLFVTLLALGHLTHGAVLFSTGWDNPTSTTVDGVRSYNTSTLAYAANSIAITGGGSNGASPANFWTVTNAAQVDLSSVSLVKASGGIEVGAASGNDGLFKGSVFTTLMDFSNNNGTLNSGIRYATGGTPTNFWAPQSNSSSVNNTRFNVLFEIKSGVSLSQWNIAFNYGTATTATGVWDTNTATQNGTADVDIYSVAGDGTLSLSSLTFTGVSLSGSGPLASLNADSMAASLGSGNYLLSIALTGKTNTQRYTIDNLVVSAIPEPGSFALVGIAFLSLLGLRRRAK